MMYYDLRRTPTPPARPPLVWDFHWGNVVVRTLEELRTRRIKAHNTAVDIFRRLAKEIHDNG